MPLTRRLAAPRKKSNAMPSPSPADAPVISATILPQRTAQRMPPHAPKPRRVRRDTSSTVEVLADGTEILIAHEPAVSLHWSPARGFHYGRNCCKRGGSGRGARVSSQRFAGIDAAAGRPFYVRGRF